MSPLEFAIGSLPLKSLNGLRAKALVALYKVRPVDAWDTEFDFWDEFAFQQFFVAVTQLLGLTKIVASTGYSMPELLDLEGAEELAQRSSG